MSMRDCLIYNVWFTFCCQLKIFSSIIFSYVEVHRTCIFHRATQSPSFNSFFIIFISFFCIITYEILICSYFFFVKSQVKIKNAPSRVINEQVVDSPSRFLQQNTKKLLFINSEECILKKLFSFFLGSSTTYAVIFCLFSLPYLKAVWSFKYTQEEEM